MIWPRVALSQLELTWDQAWELALPSWRPSGVASGHLDPLPISPWVLGRRCLSSWPRSSLLAGEAWPPLQRAPAPAPQDWRQAWPHLPTGSSANPAVSRSPSLITRLCPASFSQDKPLAPRQCCSRILSLAGGGQDPLLPAISLRADVPVARPSLPDTLCYSHSRQPLSVDWLSRQGSQQRKLSHAP